MILGGAGLGGKPRFNSLGLLLCLFTNFLLAIIKIIVKVLTVPSIQKNFERVTIVFFILLPFVSYLVYKGKDDIFGPPKMLKFIVVRAVIGNITGICLYYAVTKIPVGDAVSLTFFSTVLTGIVSYILLGEPFTTIDCVCAVFSVAGVILISKPRFMFGELATDPTISPEDHRNGIIAGILSAFLISANLTLARKVSHVKTRITVFHFAFWGVLITSFISWISYGGYTLPCRSQLPLTFMHGLLALTASLCMALALRYERAVTYAICRSLQIILVFFFQIVILKDQTNWLSVSGASLIFISAVGVAIHRFYNENKSSIKPVTSNNSLVYSDE